MFKKFFFTLNPKLRIFLAIKLKDSKLMVVVNTKNSNPYLKIMALNTAFHAHTHKIKMDLLKDATVI